MASRATRLNPGPLDVTMSETLWLRIAAALLIVTGAVWIRRREFRVGWEGEPPAFFVRGRAAFLCGAILIFAGVLFLLWPWLIAPWEVRF